MSYNINCKTIPKKAADLKQEKGRRWLGSLVPILVGLLLWTVLPVGAPQMEPFYFLRRQRDSKTKKRGNILLEEGRDEYDTTAEEWAPTKGKGISFELMTELYHHDEVPQHWCWDRRYYSSPEEQLLVMKDSKTIYVGNLSFFTTEIQLHQTFSVVGPVKRIIMGLNSLTKTPCGFGFVEYYSRDHAAAATNYISGTICDGRVIRCDMDAGFQPGRQFGRGASGGQIRDERRNSYDPARGGTVSTLGKRGADARDYSQPPRRPQDQGESSGDILNAGVELRERDEVDSGGGKRQRFSI